MHHVETERGRPSLRRVDVHVEQARDEILAAAIHYGCTVGDADLRLAADCSDSIATNDHSLMRGWLSASYRDDGNVSDGECPLCRGICRQRHDCREHTHRAHCHEKGEPHGGTYIGRL